ncbi:ABC transporter ATP-binding protein [Comamonas sp. JC664]|uniref:ABC transporter ATP-binding protein n=1 Tax=Comamonas sp. JC664 TaxID=2801917 RepID=UPI00174DE924|nr:ABC transporter ATP-binding protein [Comamonas sp. JC664]MBL0696319.1 ABC transporter ATP-binding protein [Comamonas sp. JC664]GHG66461.1 nitrate ABC transporter ATP-binding protein [Comamonas sp. KCTC 72670]
MRSQNAAKRLDVAAPTPSPPSQAQPAKLSVAGLTVTFPVDGTHRTVLEAIDFECHEGELVCLLGPSGCGKSTLLNVIGGFLKPTQGQVLIDGAPVTGPDPRRIFVFQERGVFPWLTVEGNIGFGIQHLPAEERRQRVAHYVEMVGLRGFERAYPAELSGGMKQRLEVARALAVGPDMLYLDESFGALDYITRHNLRRELLHLWATERKTILFVTHDIDESVQLANRVVVMAARPGRIQRVVDIDLPYPRDISSARYLRYRDELLEELGLAHQR